MTDALSWVPSWAVALALAAGVTALARLAWRQTRHDAEADPSSQPTSAALAADTETTRAGIDA